MYVSISPMLAGLSGEVGKYRDDFGRFIGRREYDCEKVSICSISRLWRNRYPYEVAHHLILSTIGCT